MINIPTFTGLLLQSSDKNHRARRFGTERDYKKRCGSQSLKTQKFWWRQRHWVLILPVYVLSESGPDSPGGSRSNSINSFSI